MSSLCDNKLPTSEPVPVDMIWTKPFGMSVFWIYSAILNAPNGVSSLGFYNNRTTSN
ncbi:hypothetical protein [Staphylococcus pseudoxylosus]|uniref:hypothetical protein n=1 Tax=Staphylococcus pseudoxylosus TaxID=2282419 RepID=UPI003D802BC7